MRPRVHKQQAQVSRNFWEDRGSDRRPTNKSCWRYAFCFHLEEAKRKNGYMIQVKEKDGLGAGQKIETEMAEQIGLKIFRTTTKDAKFNTSTFWLVSEAVRKWYESGCKNNNLHWIGIW